MMTVQVCCCESTLYTFVGWKNENTEYFASKRKKRVIFYGAKFFHFGKIFDADMVGTLYKLSINNHTLYTLLPTSLPPPLHRENIVVSRGILLQLILFLFCLVHFFEKSSPFYTTEETTTSLRMPVTGTTRSTTMLESWVRTTWSLGMTMLSSRSSTSPETRRRYRPLRADGASSDGSAEIQSF